MAFERLGNRLFDLNFDWSASYNLYLDHLPEFQDFCNRLNLPPVHRRNDENDHLPERNRNRRPLGQYNLPDPLVALPFPPFELLPFNQLNEDQQRLLTLFKRKLNVATSIHRRTQPPFKPNLPGWMSLDDNRLLTQQC